MTHRSLLHSVFGRLTLIFLAISLASTLVLYLAVARTVRQQSAQALAREIDTDLAGLSDIYATGGKAELVARIRDRLVLERADGEQGWYLLANAAGQRIAGNLAVWPELSAERSQAGTIRVGGQSFHARATMLGPDARLVVGRSNRGAERLVERIGGAFLTTGAVLALLSLVGGYASTRRLGRRVDGVNAAFAAVRNGDISARAPGDRASDELGTLAANTNHMLDQVTRLIEAQRNISDQTAHEIRTPLMHLDTGLLKALDRTLDPAVADMLGKAREEIRGVVRLLDSLLDIAGTEGMKGDVRGLNMVDLSAIGEGLADLYSASAEELGLSFEAQVTPGVNLRGDEMQLMRLMTNLLDNAFKYVPSGGHVLLRIGPGPRIMVADNGPGIPIADRERIFDRYVRLDPGAGREGSHGLGLALARAIAQRHHLAIHVEDAAPGARFVVEPERAGA